MLEIPNQNKTAIIIGAGPAGLTAAYELLEKTDIKPIIFEMTADIGGISKTVNYKGNRIDMGGHRFFSKSDRVMDFWQKIMPLQGFPAKDDLALSREVFLSDKKDAPDPQKEDKVFLSRNRISRIFYLRSFFNYPVALNFKTLKNLGFLRVAKIGFSYLLNKLRPQRQEKSLEDFMINRFGKELYLTFFKDYTTKVWGVSPAKIPADWGAQRIKGVSIRNVLLHALKAVFKKDNSLDQKNVETSLIGRFMYPKLGPGQLWEEVARLIKEKGGEIYLRRRVEDVILEEADIDGVKKVKALRVRDLDSGETKEISGDYYFSIMPIKDLIKGMGEAVPKNVREVAKRLRYRDFITVGLLLGKLKIKNETKIKTINNIVPDNWIYIQERDVKLGRLQIFNNWSPYMVADDSKAWIGLEYFCNEGDELWKMENQEFINFAISELEKIEIIDSKDVLDSTIVKMPKTYPAYFGAYRHFDLVQDFTNKIENLFLIGRNGMHKYNNADHSMLTAMIAVENIINGRTDKSNIWEVNTEEEYHEEK